VLDAECIKIPVVDSPLVRRHPPNLLRRSRANIGEAAVNGQVKRWRRRCREFRDGWLASGARTIVLP
jgi:hypothetical protein